MLFMCEEGTVINLDDISSIEPATREQEGAESLAVERGEIPPLWIIHHLSGRHKTEARLSMKDLDGLRKIIMVSCNNGTLSNDQSAHTTDQPTLA
jgi:hypothetical protein